MPVSASKSTGSLAKTLPRAKAPVMNLGPAKPQSVSKQSYQKTPVSVRGSAAYKGKYGVKVK
jgi:hypothetical protein